MSVRRYAALVAVLTGGVCASLPFYKSARTATPELQPDPISPADNPPAALELPSIAVDSSPAQPASALESPQPGKLPAWCRPMPIAVPADSRPLPRLPHVPIARKAARSSHIQEPDFASDDSWRKLPASEKVGSEAGSFGHEARPVAAPRRHRIADGDSLPGLALRYLGDERRSGEIAQLNRQLIRDPNLLPVGIDILIPQEE